MSGKQELSPYGVVVISQSCDVVREDERHPNLIIAKIAHLTSEESRRCRKKEQPRFVHLPGLGNEVFADLEFIATVAKNGIRPSTIAERIGVDPEDEKAVGMLASQISRRFGRFPFPDNLTPAIRDVQKKVSERYLREDSPIAKVFACIADMRLECSAEWSRPPFDLTLHLIFNRSYLYGLSAESRSTGTPKAFAKPKSVGEIALMLFPAGPDKPDQMLAEDLPLWLALGESLVSKWKDLSIDGVTASITVNMTDVEEFTYWEYLRSESFDLDYLSPAVPWSDPGST